VPLNTPEAEYAFTEFTKHLMSNAMQFRVVDLRSQLGTKENNQP
jgi:hypothetical protein